MYSRSCGVVDFKHLSWKLCALKTGVHFSIVIFFIFICVLGHLFYTTVISTSSSNAIRCRNVHNISLFSEL
jgi:hypothetical protein